MYRIYTFSYKKVDKNIMFALKRKKKELKSHLLLHPTIKNLKNQTFQNQDTLIAKITFHSFIKKKEKKIYQKKL